MLHSAADRGEDTTIFVCIIIFAGLGLSARSPVNPLTDQPFDDAYRYLNPDVLIDSTSCRWKMKKRSIVGIATTTEAAMM
jgi:hypothetical protein